MVRPHPFLSSSIIMSREPQTNLGNSSAMHSALKPRKGDRFKAFFKRKDQPLTTPSSQATSAQTSGLPGPSDANTGDRQRTRAKYVHATKFLGETIKSYEGQWGSFDFPELSGEPDDFDDSLFREKINAVMDAQESAVTDKHAWARCKHAVQCAFTAFSPFAKHFLIIAKEGQAVSMTPSRHCNPQR